MTPQAHGSRTTAARRGVGLLRWAAATGAACAVAAGASAQEATLRARENLAATCSQCHGVAGRALAGAAVPGLAGRPAAELVAQMKAFRDGSRPATVMQQLAKGYSDAQIEQLAAYFAAQGHATP